MANVNPIPVRSIAQLDVWGMMMRFSSIIGWLATIGLLVHGAVLHAQPTERSNRVLDLDGNDSYVELPQNIFNDLENATIEAWVKFNTDASMRFYSYGEANHDLCVGVFERGILHSFVTDPDHNGAFLWAFGSATTNRWCHVAAVFGHGGMKLFLDGALLQASERTRSFPA